MCIRDRSRGVPEEDEFGEAMAAVVAPATRQYKHSVPAAVQLLSTRTSRAVQSSAGKGGSAG
eukprot:2880215-Rhodomonas_salina.2